MAGGPRDDAGTPTGHEVASCYCYFSDSCYVPNPLSPWRVILDRMASRQPTDIVQADRALRTRYSPAQKVALLDALAGILDRLESLQRGPDPWEEDCLVHAFSHLEAGLFARAQAEVQECIVPVGQRSPWRESQVSRNPQRYTLQRLRLRFNAVKASLA